VRVERGDLLVFPSGHAHTIKDTLTSPLTRAVQLADSPQDAFQVFRFGGEQPPLVMLYGHFILSILPIIPSYKACRR